MARGIKRINCVRGLYYPKLSRPNSLYVVKPDQGVVFAVSEWYPDTTAADKKKDITWIIQTADRKTILNQILAAPNQNLNFVIPKKLCGNLTYYIEASLTGNRDKANTGLQVRGLCAPLIVSSKWSTQAGGSNIKNQAGIIKYGHVVHLNLQTEGLSQKKLIIEVYNRIGLKRKDYVVGTYTNVDCIDGAVNLEIRNTFSWMALVKNIKTDEDFYVKVKDAATNQYIKDSLGQELHAVNLKVRNEAVTTVIDGARNNKVAKVGQAQPNPIKYEQCKFNKIDVSEIEIKDGKAKSDVTNIFKEGAAKSNGSGSMTYNTIAPDHTIGKEIIVDIGGFVTQKCGTKKHIEKNVTLRNVGQALGKDDKSVIIKGQNTVKQKVYSDLSKFNLFPIQYIWPSATTPNQFWYYINSCRYYEDPVRPTVIVNVYPDVKWTLEFKWNHKIPFAYTAGNQLHPYDINTGARTVLLSEMDRTFSREDGEMAQSFELSLEAKWNNEKQKQELGKEWGEKIAKTLKIFNKMKAATDFIARSPVNGGKISFEIKAPVIAVSLGWYAEKLEGKTDIGTNITLGVESKPLVEAEGKINVWKIFREYGPNAICPGAGTIINFVIEHLEGNVGISFLVIFNGSINVKGQVQGNTAAPKDTKGELEIVGKIQVTIEFKAWAKGDLGMAGFEGYITADVSTFISGGLKGEISKDGVLGYPVLEFGGIIAKYVAVGTVKFGFFKRTYSKEGKYIIVEPNKSDFKKRYLLGPYANK